MNILHIDSSILGANSLTRPLSALAVEQAGRGASRRCRRASRPRPGPDRSSDRRRRSPPAARPMDPVLEQFKAADVIVIGSPMYNWTISSQLKAWIDRVAVAGETFAYSPQGPKGLAGGKRVIVITGRGSSMLDDRYAGYDHQEPYLRTSSASSASRRDVRPRPGRGSGGRRPPRHRRARRSRDRAADHRPTPRRVSRHLITEHHHVVFRQFRLGRAASPLFSPPRACWSPRRRSPTSSHGPRRSAASSSP